MMNMFMSLGRENNRYQRGGFAKREKSISALLLQAFENSAPPNKSIAHRNLHLVHNSAFALLAPSTVSMTPRP